VFTVFKPISKTMWVCQLVTGVFAVLLCYVLLVVSSWCCYIDWLQCFSGTNWMFNYKYDTIANSFVSLQCRFFHRKHTLQMVKKLTQTNGWYCPLMSYSLQREASSSVH